MNLKVLLLIFFLLITLTVVVVLSTSKKTKNNLPVIPASSSTSLTSPIPSSSIPKTGYTTQGLNQNYQRTLNKSLHATDNQMFSKLTQGLSGKSNVLVQNDQFTIKYVNPPNELLIEIDSNNADQAKQAAMDWLINKGFSQNGICSLKMVIYMSSSVRNYYQTNNLQFNPVPNGC